MHPDASDALDDLCVRHRHVIGYAAGHTHRHRVRTMTRSGVPSIEIGCVKDFPGTWAEYRVYEGGVMQVVHRISSPEALSWSNRCRVIYSDFGIDYEAYALGTLRRALFHHSRSSLTPHALPARVNTWSAGVREPVTPPGHHGRYGHVVGRGARCGRWGGRRARRQSRSLDRRYEAASRSTIPPCRSTRSCSRPSRRRSPRCGSPPRRDRDACVPCALLEQAAVMQPRAAR